MTRRAAALATIAACTLALAGTTTVASAAGTPSSSGVTRLIGPKWLSFGRAPAAGQRAMITQAQAAATGFTGAALYGVSCTGRAQCTATGLVTTRTGKNARTLAERWNGTKWAVQATPTPLSGSALGGTLEAGVSCTSSHACVAAGYSYTKTSAGLLAEGWNGTKWTPQPTVTPAVPAMPSGISCTWAKDCTAVGGRLNGGTLAEHWNGKRWSARPTKDLGELRGVDCTSNRSCIAVGINGWNKAMAERWTGKSWVLQSAREPMQDSQLASVSCQISGACLAVGSASSGTSLVPIAEQLTGATPGGETWARIAVPNPVPGDLSEFNSVSCVSAANCTAVGDAMNSAGTSDEAVAARWNGSSWTVDSISNPAPLSILFSVSCTSASHCVAVGADSASATGSISPLVEVWNGSTWTRQTAPR
jgi:hypothetical protein